MKSTVRPVYFMKSTVCPVFVGYVVSSVYVQEKYRTSGIYCEKYCLSCMSSIDIYMCVCCVLGMFLQI